MQPAPGSSHDEAIADWKVTVRRMASPLSGYEEVNLGAASGIWGNVPFPLANHAFLDRTLADAQAIESVTDAVCGFAASRAYPWMFAVVEPWLPAGAADVLRMHGLEPAMHVTYMTASSLVPPVRPEPSLEFRLIDNESLAQLCMDMNCECYDMPLETGRSAVAEGAMWQNDAYGYIACVDDVPVSTATTLVDEDCLNSICVATPVPHRGKGYAEAVLRHSVNEAKKASGLSRFVLHASDAGYPIYKRMGYEPEVSMMIWAPAHHEG
jgi:hypothetical protein